MVTAAAVRAALHDVKDPEIPVVSVVELGIVQDIAVDNDHVIVTITPTFSGCPALEHMRRSIHDRVVALGARDVTVVVALDPPWSSDRIAPQALDRMKTIGLAPPVAASRFHADEALALATPCPFCNGTDTVLENAFGPTICRTLYYCRGCRQSFEQFKAL